MFKHDVRVTKVVMISNVQNKMHKDPVPNNAYYYKTLYINCYMDLRGEGLQPP